MPQPCCFSFRTHGGVCAGERWIYDHEEPIARLQCAPVGQPEQNLRYFNSVPKPLELRDLRLQPGSRPLFAGVQLYWKLGPVITTEMHSLEISGAGTEILQLKVTSRDPGGVATSLRTVTVSFDAALDSYVYALEARLLIHSPETFDTPQARAQGDRIRFEYADPWYHDVPAPSVAFAGAWPKRFQRFLAEPADGSVWQMPLNHMATGIPTPQAFVTDGLFVLAGDHGGGPAIQFVGETAARTAVSVCNWGYDIHLSAHYALEALYAPLVERFRLLLCPQDHVQDLAARAAPVPPVHYAGFAQLPAYERRSSFAHALQLSAPAPGDTDPWPWLPAGEGLVWAHDCGRSDQHSLKISKSDAGPAEWTMNREGDGAWTQPWDPRIGFRLSVYVRTHQLEGRGSCVALRWALYNTPERYPLVVSRHLNGSHDWTLLAVELPGPPPADVSGVCLVLRQDGPGTTWFDDLQLEIL